MASMAKISIIGRSPGDPHYSKRVAGFGEKPALAGKFAAERVTVSPASGSLAEAVTFKVLPT